MRFREREQKPPPRRPRLPPGELRGEFSFAVSAIEEAERLLPTFRGYDGDHEGIVLLLGRQMGTMTMITTVLAPNADHGDDHVLLSENQFAEAVMAARERGLAILGQLHTHGRGSTVHSIGDDTLVIMPFEGALSLIAPWYGRFGTRPLDGLGIHQYQDGRWVLIRTESARQHLHVIPSSIDLR